MPMHVIFLEPTFPANQRQFVRALHEAGALVSGIGDRPLQYLDDQLKSWMYSYEHVQSSASTEQVTEAVKRIQARGPWVHKLECTIEALMQCAAETRERTNIPGMSTYQTELCRDKFKMKQFLRQRGIPCAKSAEVGTLGEARAFIEQVGFPVIMKPVSGAGAAGTYRIDTVDQLVSAAQESKLDPRHTAVLEEFVSGHEGFYDTLTVGGRVVFESIAHYYPNVLEAMRTREISPIVMVTNRIDSPGYTTLREFGRKVVEALQLDTTATHMEWFYGGKGLYFSEIGARPPGVRVWDLYCASNEIDLYREWANAVVHGNTNPRPSRRFATGMVAIRPNQDGRVAGYSGVAEVQRRYGDAIIEMYLPPPGTRTNAVGSGYMGNAWVWARHPDYDVCRRILEDIGSTLKMWAD